MQMQMDQFKNPQVASRTFSLLFLILLISPSCFSKDEVDLKSGEEIEQIDYKGPETHPFFPPPSNKFGPHSIFDQKSKGLQRSLSLNPLGRKAATSRDQGNVGALKP